MKILATLLVLVVTAGIGFAQTQEITASIGEPVPQAQVYQGSTTNSVGSVRRTVQRVNTRAFWRAGDQHVIDNYMACYQQKLSRVNYDCLVDALPQLVGAGIIDARRNGCLVLNQSPKHYIALWQGYCGVTTGTDWYVNVPTAPSLPVFTPGESQGALVLGDVPDVAPIPVCCPPSLPAGGLQFSKSGEHREVTLGAVYPRETREAKPPESETCPPGGEPGKPPPPGQTVGGGNQPPPQPTHNTGGQTWDPSPMHPRVADPVVR